MREIVKGTLNRGRRPDLFFSRDSRGNDVDLLVREGRRIFPLEIKSSETFIRDFLRGLENFQRLALPRTAGGLVLYNGGRRSSRRRVLEFPIPSAATRTSGASSPSPPSPLKVLRTTTRPLLPFDLLNARELLPERTRPEAFELLPVRILFHTRDDHGARSMYNGSQNETTSPKTGA